MKITDRHGCLALVIFAAIVIAFCVCTYYLTAGNGSTGSPPAIGDGIPVPPPSQK